LCSAGYGGHMVKRKVVFRWYGGHMEKCKTGTEFL
jgi:hypothetical protein